MRVAQLHRQGLLARVFGLLGAVFDGGSVADAYEAEDGCVAFGYAHDVAVEVGPCRA